jgi:hypothetical protein
MPLPPLDAITLSSDQYVLTDPFTVMANTMQTCERNLQTHEQQMMAQMQELMTHLLASHPSPSVTTKPCSCNTNKPTGRGAQPLSSSRSQSSCSTTIRKYCWSHGTCTHTGVKCKTPSTGHQPQATFPNMLNGSTSGCYWLSTST